MMSYSLYNSIAVTLAAAAGNERRTHESISSLKHHFVLFVRRPSSILKNVAEKFMWNFIFRKYSCHQWAYSKAAFHMTTTDRPVQLL